MEIRITINIDDEELKKVLGAQSDQPTRKTHEPDVYARFFNEGVASWTKYPEVNRVFLITQQQCATDKLRARGYLFLNEVYDMLGFSRTKAGQCVGWVYDEANPVGDNRVDFGIYDDCNQEFVNGNWNYPLLTFNVDGNILEYLKD